MGRRGWVGDVVGEECRGRIGKTPGGARPGQSSGGARSSTTSSETNRWADGERPNPGREREGWPMPLIAFRMALIRIRRIMEYILMSDGAGQGGSGCGGFRSCPSPCLRPASARSAFEVSEAPDRSLDADGARVGRAVADPADQPGSTPGSFDGIPRRCLGRQTEGRGVEAGWRTAVPARGSLKTGPADRSAWPSPSPRPARRSANIGPRGWSPRPMSNARSSH